MKVIEKGTFIVVLKVKAHADQQISHVSRGLLLAPVHVAD